jgi:hypothetical protein
MGMHWKYLRYVLRHKWFVLLAGLRLGVPIKRLLLHDWSKFTPLEWLGYARFFYGPHQDAVVLSPSGGRAKAPAAVAEAFDRAWLHHQQYNDHHWQHWVFLVSPPGSYAEPPTVKLRACDVKVLLKDDGTTHGMSENACELLQRLDLMPFPMPEDARREMLADWMGAGRALGFTDTKGWYERNKGNMLLHPETRAWVERTLAADLWRYGD